MPAPHQSTATSAGQGDAPSIDLRQSVYQMLIGKGLSSNQALGVLYSMMGESGTGLNPTSYNQNDPGGSIGFAQWNQGRRAGLQALAKSMGTTETDPQAQLAFFNQEISGPYASEIANVKNNAVTAADATRLWTGSVGEKSGYERPSVNNWAQRYGSGARVASVDPKTGALNLNTPNTTPANAQPAATATTAAPAAPPTSGAQDFADAAKRGDVGGALAALSKGDDKGGKGGLGSLGDQLTKATPTPQPSQMLPTASDNQGAQAQAGQALLGQLLEQSSKPLSWSSQPFGYGAAGPQTPGMTLNSMG